MPDLAPWQWMLGIFSAFMIGVAKTGAPGVGTMIVPLMVMTVGDARHAAAWTALVFINADIFAVLYWRRHAETGHLFQLIPWVAAGMAGGALALNLSEPVLRPVVGGIVVLMMAIHAWRRWGGSVIRIDPGSKGHAGFYGVFAGFATTVANASGPVMSLYLLSRDLPKEQFVATGAWFFLLVNLCKLPIYAYHGLFSRESLVFDALMAPAAICGALAGLWLLRRVNQRVFEISILALTAVSALFLFR